MYFIPTLIKKLKNHIKNSLFNGFLRQIVKPIYELFVFIAIKWENKSTKNTYYKEDQNYINNNLTIIIKTFERPYIILRLIKSIRIMYPRIKIIVVDDSKIPQRINDVQTVFLPYDSGISKGGNEAVKIVNTKYLLLLDDDFIFYRYTKVLPLLRMFEKYPNIDIIGGQVIYIPFYRKIDYTKKTYGKIILIQFYHPAQLLVNLLY